MGAYDGGNAVDSSGWQRPVNSYKNHEKHPEPATTKDGKREVTPDPYISDDAPVVRNFGWKAGNS